MIKKRLASLLATVLTVITLSAQSAEKERIVLVHTNDTHSHIDPTSNGEGGILRRKVLTDSIRNAEKNVIVIDAGDALQGSVYFTLFGGEVERKMMNAVGYDYQIMGNHEFDNGLESLANQWKQANAELLSTNYDLSGTPLDGIVKPYAINETGGRKLGIIAINVDPYGLVAPHNYENVEYLDGIKAANATAWHLKHNEKCDMVIAVTHIGYSSRPGYNDLDLAGASEDIDIIIGGHSHTRIDPNSKQAHAVNAKGDTILIAQAGKWGREIGEVIIEPDGKTTSNLIKVDSRLDNSIDPEAAAILAPYRHSVDSILSVKVGRSASKMVQGSTELVNMISDLVAEIGSNMAGRKVDLALMNRGGIRCDLPKSDITKGLLMQMMPFDNRITLLELKGSDLTDAFDVMAGRNGDGVSSEVRAKYDSETKKSSEVTINGEPIDPDRIYLISTIDYLAEGGDYMKPLTKGKIIGVSTKVVYDDMIDHLKSSRERRGKKLKPDTTKRWERR